MTPAMRRAEEEHERRAAIEVLVGLCALIENADALLCAADGVRLRLSWEWKERALLHLPRAVALLRAQQEPAVEEAHPVFKDPRRVPLRMLEEGRHLCGSEERPEVPTMNGRKR